MLTYSDPITWNPQRITVAGTSGAGKSTLCAEVSEVLGVPYVELDSLHWGPGWTSRDDFAHDVAAFTAQPHRIVERQYRTATVDPTD